MNLEVVQLNDGDAEGWNLNGYVDLGPDMCGTGVVGTNNGCDNLDCPMDSLNPIGELRNPVDHVRLVWMELQLHSQRAWLSCGWMQWVTQ
jgi:hypothetical protein